MAPRAPLVFCSLCLRDIAEQRHIKGNVCLKYSGSSTSEVVAYIIGQEVPIVSICFRCYRLLLGIDYHQHEFKRLKDTIVKIYCERCTPLEKSHSSASEFDSSDAKKLFVERQLSTFSEFASTSVYNSFNTEYLRYNLQNADVDECLNRTEEPRKEGFDSDIKDGIGSSEQSLISGIPTEERNVKISSVSVRSSKRSKKLKKLQDFEYYTDTLNDTSKTGQSAEDAVTLTDSHTLLSESKEKNFCSLCSKNFATKKHFRNHSCMRTVCKNISFKCKGCQMLFSVRQEYLKHIDSCYKNVPVKCHLCMVELQSAAYLPRHLEAFHNGASMTQKSSLCDLCGRTFSRKEALQRHQAKVHRVSYGTHQCPKCGQTFLHTSLLMEHIRAHRGYPCKDCNKIFTCMSNLKVHKQTYHQNKTLYVCSLCNKRWRFHTSYTNHMRKIHGEAQFKCPRCKVFFSAENAFEKHKEICAGIYKRPTLKKIPQASAPSKTKKSLSHFGEVSASYVYANSNRMPAVASTDHAANYIPKNDKNYLRLKKVVRKVSSSIKHQVAVPSKDVLRIGKKSNKVSRVTDLSNNNPSGKASTEIVLEALEDLNNDCQLVILVEDGSDENK